MKNIELLNVSSEIKDKILSTDQNYRRFLNIACDILEADNNTLTVRVKQFSRATDKIYDSKELIEKAKEVFSHLPEGFSLRFRALTFKGEGIEAVSPSWVKNMLKKHGLTQNEISEKLGVDKHVISKLLNNQEYAFTRWHKAAFYYFFKAL